MITNVPRMGDNIKETKGTIPHYTDVVGDMLILHHFSVFERGDA